MTTYKLHYYNGKGLGEVSRYLFALAKQSYEDHRYVDEEDNEPDFPTMEDLKSSGKLPFDQVPILEVTKDGHTITIAQSNAIQRYLSRTFGYLGSSSEENAIIDSLVEDYIDVRREYGPIPRLQDKEEQARQYEKFYGVTLPKHLGFLQRFVHQGSNYLSGNHISLADVCWFYLFEYFNNQDLVGKLLSSHPWFVTWRERVHGLLAEYIANRPLSIQRYSTFLYELNLKVTDSLEFWAVD